MTHTTCMTNFQTTKANPSFLYGIEFFQMCHCCGLYNKQHRRSLWAEEDLMVWSVHIIVPFTAVTLVAFNAFNDLH